MSDRADGPEQSQALRDLARRARRLALSVSNGDRRQLLQHAEQLEQQALEMEQGVPQAAPPPVVQVQVQQQQQQETGPPADPETPKPKD
jgi:hypothetical protein